MGSSREPTVLLDPRAGIATPLPGNLGPDLDGPVVRGAGCISDCLDMVQPTCLSAPRLDPKLGKRGDGRTRVAGPLTAPYPGTPGGLGYASGQHCRLGFASLIRGLWALDIAWLTLGLVLTTGPKMWFLDRMVWLYDGMARTRQEYAAWLR